MWLNEGKQAKFCSLFRNVLNKCLLGSRHVQYLTRWISLTKAERSVLGQDCPTETEFRHICNFKFLVATLKTVKEKNEVK